jgi:CubicO group peptidase (beta-lactamase class C family)
MTRYRNFFKIILPFIILLVFYSCKQANDPGQENTPAYTYKVPEQVGDGWETAHANDEGINLNPLIDMMNNYFGIYYRDVHGILIIKNGKVVFEEYFPGHDFGPGSGYKGRYLNFNRDTLHCMHSVTKSFASTCIGLALDMGFIPDVNQRLFSFFPEFGYLRDADKDKVTIEHLLTMTSGFQWNEGDLPLSDLNNDLTRLIRSTNPIQYILEKPIVAEPGSTYYYSGGDTNLLGEIVNRATGLNADLFSSPHLFTKLGITNYYWTYFPYAEGVVYVSGDIYLRPRDMAKFGLLFLNEGVWQGERIISKEWVNQATQKRITFRDPGYNTGYGYQWWRKKYTVNNKDFYAYCALGWGGQAIMIFSQLNSVFVFTGGNYVTYVPVDHIVSTYILSSFL